MRSYRKDGLTLLEVLAAFLIFSLVFTVLVGSSQTAVHSQGLSIRRLTANEIAESKLAELEMPMVRYELPVIEEEEVELEGFTVRVYEEALGGEASPGDLLGAMSGGDLGAGGDILSVLELQMPEVAKYLKRYRVEVEWMEANDIQTVSRTTFAFDWSSAQTDASGLIGAAAAAGGINGTAGGEDGSGESASEDASGGASGADGSGSSKDARDRSRASSQSEAERIKQMIRDATR